MEARAWSDAPWGRSVRCAAAETTMGRVKWLGERLEARMWEKRERTRGKREREKRDLRKEL